MEKENAQLHTNAEPSALDSANSTCRTTFTPRQKRVIRALKEAQDWLARETIDRIAGASNGPQIILEVRRKLTGYEGIEMEMVARTDRDGRPCKPGRYRLTSMGRAKVEAALAQWNNG